mgnify:CR=1 FL=1
MTESGSYNPKAFQTYITKKVRKKVVKMIAESSEKLLDIGCGNGAFLRELDQKTEDLRLYGIDNDPIVMEKARNITRNTHSENYLHFSLQDGKNTDFPDNYFDIITLLTTTININSENVLSQLLNEMFRICKPDGKIIFEFRNGENFLLKLKYYISSKIQNIPIETFTKNEIEKLIEPFEPSSLKFEPVGLKLPILSLSYLAIIEV